MKPRCPSSCFTDVGPSVAPRCVFRNRQQCSSLLSRSRWQPPGRSGNCANTPGFRSVNCTRPPRGEYPPLSNPFLIWPHLTPLLRHVLYDPGVKICFHISVFVRSLYCRMFVTEVIHFCLVGFI